MCAHEGLARLVFDDVRDDRVDAERVEMAHDAAPEQGSGAVPAGLGEHADPGVGVVRLPPPVAHDHRVADDPVPIGDPAGALGARRLRLDVVAHAARGVEVVAAQASEQRGDGAEVARPQGANGGAAVRSRSAQTAREPTRAVRRTWRRAWARPAVSQPDWGSPSQQPSLNRQRGHCHVPCRHSISALQRQHRSVMRSR